ncbi:MAG: phosphate signaling complex protein PhoU [Deferribacteres bacterium]|nr:phosphate signaling complex protein PhoU [candidate division KSB1 bacterium]MCB9503380.1 phosphate signaling complex protein PhoU [Deferribacteres bacterium]
MHRKFEDELDVIRQELLYMASLTESAIHGAVDSLKNRDAKLAEKIIAEDDHLNEQELKIDNLCINQMALKNPIAGDLRLITAALKINNDLERIGDHAVNIAERTLTLVQEPELKPLIDIPRMAEITMEMMRKAIDAFLHNDCESAKHILEMDAQVNELEQQIIRELITYIANDPKTINRALALIMVAKNLERVGDLTKNIAEEVVFMVEAKLIKHGKIAKN